MFLSLIISNVRLWLSVLVSLVSQTSARVFYASEDTERYLVETSAWKHASVPRLTAQLKNTLEHSRDEPAKI